MVVPIPVVGLIPTHSSGPSSGLQSPVAGLREQSVDGGTVVVGGAVAIVCSGGSTTDGAVSGTVDVVEEPAAGGGDVVDDTVEAVVVGATLEVVGEVDEGTTEVVVGVWHVFPLQ